MHDRGDLGPLLLADAGHPLLAQLADLGPLTVTYLDEGPDAWRLRLTRA